MSCRKYLDNFDRQLGSFFPGMTDIVADLRDPDVVIKILNNLFEQNPTLKFILSQNKSRASNPSSAHLEDKYLVVNMKNGTMYRIELPVKLLVARFPRKRRLSFIRLSHCTASLPVGPGEEDKSKNYLSLVEDTLLSNKKGTEPSTRNISPDKDAGANVVKDKENQLILAGKREHKAILFFPKGSILNDKRLYQGANDLAAKGRQSDLFEEIIRMYSAMDELVPDKVILDDYLPEDAALWDEWNKHVDFSAFQTYMKPKNFETSNGIGDDYFLKMINYNGKKVGATWLEQISKRTSSAQIGIIIGDPNLRGVGIGSLVAKSIIDIAKTKLSLNFLWFSVNESNRRAVRCYLKCGFTVKRKYPLKGKDGSYSNWLLMEKIL